MVYGCLLLLHLAVGGEQPDPKAVAYGGVILVMLCLTVGPMVGPIKHGKSICHPLQRMKGGLALKMEGVSPIPADSRAYFCCRVAMPKFWDKPNAWMKNAQAHPNTGSLQIKSERRREWSSQSSGWILEPI